MDKLQISGGTPLQGEIKISGAKNSVLPILAGCLLADAPVMVKNVPHLNDVTTMMKLLGQMGVDFTISEGLTIEVNAAPLHLPEAPYELVRTMRASILVLGPLLSKYRTAKVSL